jgi:hypothetical protein
MKLRYASYGESYGLKYLCTAPSAQYFVHMVHKWVAQVSDL